MSKIAVVYWSGTGNTEAMAKAMLSGARDAGADAALFNVSDFSADKMSEYNAFMLGCPAMGAEDAPLYLKYLREIAMAVLMGLSLVTTPKKVRYEDNKYTWAPILEVAALFLGIFTTMAPALIYLKENASALGLSQTWHFYYSTGLLSSFLDNTPTAVAFHGLATGLPESLDAAASGLLVNGDGIVNGVPFVAGVPEMLLKAISIGAVFFGAMTYIGNGPNFMVKAIAEEAGINMPSFFGYMIKFSLIILLPVYILVQLIFL